MIGSKVMFKYLGDIMKGEVLNIQEELILIRSTRNKNYLVKQTDILRYLHNF